jgi:hypothetical protein
MKVFVDYKGREVRLTDERYSHILEHAEMSSMQKQIEETLNAPDVVVSDNDNVGLNYRHYYNTKVGNKWLCVVVKYNADDAFVLTAYLTNRIKKGEVVWKRQ